MDVCPGKKKNSADYKAEEEQERCSRKREEEKVSPEDIEAIASMAQTKK